MMQEAPYVLGKDVKDTEWDVDGIIASGTLALFVAKSSAGKSFLVEYMAICMVYGHKFLGKKTKPLNVLIIDQDTPTNILEQRLNAFDQHMKELNLYQKRRIFVESMKDLYLDNGSLLQRIKDTKAQVVIIDCLGRVAGSLNVNDLNDMSAINVLKKAANDSGKTLILIHHISEKSGVTIDELMKGEDINKYTMGSSAINQLADTLFLLASKARSKLRDLYVRPISKRFMLGVQKPFVARLVEKENSKHFAYAGEYEAMASLCDVDRDILLLFQKSPKERRTYQVCLDMGDKHRINAVRAGLYRLVASGALKENRVNPKLFTYELQSSE